MNDSIYDDVSTEKQIKSSFGLDLEIDAVIARRLPVGRATEATLFLTTKKQLYFYVNSQSPMLLSDVKKVVSRAGLVAELYLPPIGKPRYFEDYGTIKFQEIFPGRRVVSDEDVIFYKTLAPYNPALVLIREVKSGIVYQYDSDAKGGWRPSVKFSYRRIVTS